MIVLCACEKFSSRQMLQNLIIVSLWIVAIKATGEFTILSSPNSLSFQGIKPIKIDDIEEVFNACLGNPVSGDSCWPGIIINDPINLPKVVIAVKLIGVAHSKISAAGKTYTVQGNELKKVSEVDSETVCTISFEQFEEGKLSFRSIFGDVKIPPVAKTKYLNGNLHTADKNFLESCAFLYAIADNFSNMKKPCTFVDVILFPDAIVQAHGEGSEAISEALDIHDTAMKYFNTSIQEATNNEALVVVVANKADGINRSKRQVDSKDNKNNYNLAEYYSEDYPVIFNIILWFMVVFGFALLAICYAIGSMDPGRDSIIYRMTSTRMKKDN